PLAYLLARYHFKGHRLLSVLVELPIVLPPAVAGLALLLAFGRNGLLGAWLLAWFGVSLPFTSAAVVIAQTFVSMPFYVRTAQVGFQSIPPVLEEAARVDGADAVATMFYITLPLARRALVAGMLLSWARALGEFGATILFAGSLEGRTQTLSLLVYNAFERDLDAAIWTAVVLIAVAMATMLVARSLFRETDRNDALT
ncbi:MAG: molybdate ABC transporter permease subunit, partial [Chloroflexi bacterium]|nr:molybdate ABC transporter permease subunit [Chloroflexota bacterium]